MTISEETRTQIVTLVRDFVSREVEPVADKYDHEDIYPSELVEVMKQMGLFGITISEDYGGLGLDHLALASIFEELSKGWMSLSGVIGTHHIMASIISEHGTDEQKRKFLPKMATGEIRGGLGLTEPDAGSDVQNISTVATRERDQYLISGRKMFITNAENGNAFAVLVKTDRDAVPRYRGMSCFIVTKPNTGLSVGQHIDKLGYRGLDTSELIFENCKVGIDNLVGGIEGHGFKHVMSGLEPGRINVAARAVGGGQAALDAAISYSQQRKTFGQPIAQHQAIQLKLADMATKVHAARLMVYDAAAKKDSGLRNDMEASMAKLFASEICGEVAMEAMRVHGGAGYIKDLPVERYYRDSKLCTIGEGTSEIQKVVISKQIIK